jgi:hypothetical protein
MPWSHRRESQTFGLKAARGRLARFPFERNRSNDKKSRQIKMMEQALIEKVYQLF